MSKTLDDCNFSSRSLLDSENVYHKRRLQKVKVSTGFLKNLIFMIVAVLRKFRRHPLADQFLLCVLTSHKSRKETQQQNWKYDQNQENRITSFPLSSPIPDKGRKRKLEILAHQICWKLPGLYFSSSPLTRFSA